MLVLSRKSDQAVLIGETIKVTVVRVRGNVVTLGIEAPKSVRVLREEIAGQGPKSPASDERSDAQVGATTETHPNPSTDESQTDANDIAPLSDLEDMLYEPEDYATQAAFASPLAQYMFAP